jgi:hypothetical protein
MPLSWTITEKMHVIPLSAVILRLSKRQRPPPTVRFSA